MRNTISRRAFIQSAAVAAAVVPKFGWAGDTQANEWGVPVLDTHFHPRATAAEDISHLDGAGVTKAVLLASALAEGRAAQAVAAYPSRFCRFAAIAMTEPNAIEYLRGALRNGAKGFGEMKSPVAAAGPEMQRLYAVAAELDVPIVMHFQDFSPPGNPGTFNAGFKKFDAMLKAFPKTTFVGHADAFRANVSADYAGDASYPRGSIKPGGLTDRFLAEYPNIYADLSANSGNNFLTRDPDFAARFIDRHQDKLTFGSDCTCSDGRGAGTGRCIARSTLTQLKRLATQEVFRKIVWENGPRILKIG
jgi:predicted TIM-barrel fold metal-dependent hydrolase